MKGMGYSFVINYINIFSVFYLPAVYILVPRKGRKYVNWIVLTSLFMVWVALSRYVINFSAVIYPLIINICVVIVMFEVMYRDSWKRKLAAVMYYFLVGIISDTIAVFFLQFLIPEMTEIYVNAQRSAETNMIHLLANLCCETVTMTAAAAYLCLIWKKQRKLFGVFMLIPVYQMILGTGYFILCGDFTEQVAQTGLVTGVFNLVLNIVVIYFLESILRKQDIEAKIRQQEKSRQQEYVYFETVSQSAEELRMIRHDFSNHLQIINKTMENPEGVNTAKAMLEEMRRRVEK